MSSNKKIKTKFNYSKLYTYLFVLIIIFLTSINIRNYFKPNKVAVLGIETVNSEFIFWQEFLTEHPNYVPGWIEIGRGDKGYKIDPNFEYNNFN